MGKTALALFAHPDDAEIFCAGTLCQLKKAGYEIHIATVANGDKGSAEYNQEEIARIRRAEAIKAAAVIGASYHCLDFEDVYVFYNRESIDKASDLLRKIQPSIVFAHSPSDYMIDHEMSSKIAQAACFNGGLMNMQVDAAPFEPVPYLYYTDAMESKDKLGTPIISNIWVDITSEIGTKEEMLACHASQRNWLLEHHKVDEYLMAMKRAAKSKKEESGYEYAEGFRQHLGHSFPQDNILLDILGEKTVKMKKHLSI